MDSRSSPSVSSASPPGTTIKKEAPEEEIKEYAETAMNELLGWYGYERLELRRWAAATSRAQHSPDSNKSPDSKEKDECSWCNNPITIESALHQSGAKFCSELCFSQSRRANFKRAKTCDWCRHVRHTVAYVDFQDGATQLQFCSDKCLNQYKMHIFCRETQAHLDLNPHLAGGASTSNLITPDLWMKNCRSRSTSPTSEKSHSPTATAENLAMSKPPPPVEKPEPIPTKSGRKSPLPLITIAPTSKLLKKQPAEERIVLRSSPEHKRDLRSSKVSLRKRRSSRCSSTVTSQSLARQNNVANLPKTQDARGICTPPSTLEGSSPGSSTIGNSAIHSPPQPLNAHHIPCLPPHNFSTPMFSAPPHPPLYADGIPQSHLNDPRFPRAMFPPPNFIPRPGMMFNQDRPRLPPSLPFMQMGLAQPPPITILVPYPVPIPLPIPIPIPLTSLLQAYNLRRTPTGTQAKSGDDDGAEGPLDFTMNVGKKREDAAEEQLNSEEYERKENVNQNNNDMTQSNGSDDIEKTECGESNNPEQTLPRFKITRLGTKMAKIVAKPREPPESARPLRKRRRLVEVHTDEDCTPLIPKSRKIVQV